MFGEFWSYRKFFSGHLPPFRRIALRKADRGFEAYAYLEARYRPGALQSFLYGEADGTGTDRSRVVAVSKAVSEGLERWAFYTARLSAERQNYAFDIDDSTNGMAAMPKVLASQVRQKAFFEAVERWSLCAWWEGRLNASRCEELSGYQVLRIHTPWQSAVMLIIWKISAGFDAIYGFSCDQSFERAFSRALTEAKRNDAIATRMSAANLVELAVNERRFIFFASEQGHGSFMEQVCASTCSRAVTLSQPGVLVDSVISGEWSRWACVHRVLFEPVSNEGASEADNYFLF